MVADFDVGRAGRSDALEDTLDYDRMAAICREVALSRHHDLIEAVAEQIASRCLSELGVTRVEVRIEKPGAVPDAAAVGVRIVRSAA